MLLSEYSADENPEFELVEVIVFVDRSMTGAFELGMLLLLLLLDPVAAEAVVDVGEGELDDALYASGAERIFFNLERFAVGKLKLTRRIVRLVNRSWVDRSVVRLVGLCLHDR